MTTNRCEKRWKWDDAKVSALLDHLLSYKTEMEFQGLDFQSDLVLCYSKVRKMMANNFPPADFGPQTVQSEDIDSMDMQSQLGYRRKIQQFEKLKKEGYNRVKSKIKELRAGYKVAVDKGTRSGSGKLVYDHFEKLQQIWGGSPSVITIQGKRVSFPVDECYEVSEEDKGEKENDDHFDQPGMSSNKRAKMEKKMSLHQKEMIQINLMKEELQLKKEAFNVMKENAKSTQEAIKAMAESMTTIGQSLREGFAMISHSIVQSQHISNASTFPYANPRHPHFYGPFSATSSDSNSSSFSGQ